MKTLFDKIALKIKNNSKVVENYLFMTILPIISMLIGLLLYPYLIRVLGKTTYGTYIFVYSNIQFFQLFVSCGLDMPALKRVSQSPNDLIVKAQVLSNVFTARIVVFCMAFAVLLAISLFVPFVATNLLLYIIIFSLLLVEILFPVWYFQGIQKMKVVTYVNLLVRALSIPLILIFVKNTSDIIVYAFIISGLHLLGAIFAHAYIYIKEGVAVRLTSLFDAIATIKEALPFFFTSAFETIRKEAITFIIGTFMGMQNVAIYDLANKIVMIPRMLTSSINNAFFPNIIQNREPQRIKRIMQYENYLSMAIILLIVVFGYWAVILLGGQDMTSAYPVAVILSLVVYRYLLVGSYVNFVFIPNGRYKFVLANQLLAMFCFLLLAVVVILFYRKLFMIAMLFSFSHLVEVFYCQYLTRKYKLL